MTKKELVRSYVDQYDLPNQTLARKIIKENPELFASCKNPLDACRTAIRQIIGQVGENERKKYKCDSHRFKEKSENAINANVPSPFSYYENIKRTTPAKILIFDIETAPIEAFVWSAWKQNVGSNQIINDWFMISWAAKWLFEDFTISEVLTPKEILNKDDRRITGILHGLINEADIVIAHNGDKFDIKKINTRFLKHGFASPSSYHSIDTLKTLRRRFAITHNRLDYVGEFLGLGRKIETGGFDLWVRCMKGDAEALNEMDLYCKQDVKLLEDVYLMIRPYIKPHPNIGLYIEENIDSCPSCGHDKLILKSTYTTTVNEYNELQCMNCGSWSRSRRTNTPLQKNEGIKSSLPR
jgi:DNA polymerase III epsilon subunit-like protein